MNTQEIINRLCIIKRDWPGTAQDIDRLLLADLEAQLRIETAARGGSANATRTIAKILKDNAEDPRESLRYPWVDGEGRQCVCDGFQAYRLREHLPLIERPDDAGRPIDLDRIFPPSLNGWKPLPMPSAAELRETISLQRAKWTGRRKDFLPIWDFGPQAPSVNAQYLLNAATVFPDAAEIFWLTLVSPLVVRGEGGDAVILPVRCSAKTQPPVRSEDEQRAIDAEKAQQEANNKAVLREYEEREKRSQAVSAAWDIRHKAQLERIKAQQELKDAKDEAAIQAASEKIVEKYRAEGEARLRHSAAMLEADPTYSIELEELTEILDMVYMVA